MSKEGQNPKNRVTKVLLAVDGFTVDGGRARTSRAKD